MFLSLKNFPTDPTHLIQLSPNREIVSTNQDFCLTADDFSRISLVQLSDKKAFLCTASKRDTSVFSHILDQRSALLHTLSVSYECGLKLVAFFRNIPEFESLCGRDRFILFKYNCPLVFFIRLCLNYDTSRDLIIDSEADTEEYAVACKHMAYQCYGEQLPVQLNQLYQSTKEIVGDDPLILQLMMIIMVFANNVSVEDIAVSEDVALSNSRQVYQAQSIYTSLLFRYMMGKYSTYDQAVWRYSRLIQKTIQMQMLAQTYRKFLQEHLIDARDEEIHPVMKSILRMS